MMKVMYPRAMMEANYRGPPSLRGPTRTTARLGRGRDAFAMVAAIGTAQIKINNNEDASIAVLHGLPFAS